MSKPVGVRECLVNGVVGQTGSGKSFTLHKEIAFYTKPGANRTGRKVLVFDTNGEYTELPAIANCQTEPEFKKIMNAWQKVEGRRINAQNWSRDQKYQGLLWCHSHFKNGLLVIDDIDKIAVHTKSQAIIGTLMGNRHDALDVTLCHQSLEMPTHDFYRNVTTLRLHHQRFNSNNLKDRAKGSYNILKIASLIIKRQYESGNKYYFLTMHLRNEKIYGIPNTPAGRKEFELAVRKYLTLEPAEIREEISEMDAAGLINYKDRNSTATREKAISRLMQQYYKFIQ